MSDEARYFTPTEYAILKIVQKNIPDSLTPYADIAKEAGATEEEVLNLLQRLKDEGAIRRFGASLKHQKAGFTHNAMVAWIVDEQEVDSIGAKAAEHPLISHCYFRPSTVADWPYELYTMIHGRHEDEYKEVIAELQKTTPLNKFAVLESIKEMKKTSMVYFP